jgi:hypothetical protein
MPATPTTTTKAKLTSIEPKYEVTVHFNPQTLVFSLEKATSQNSGDKVPKQLAGQLSGKLTVDLQFDTTDTGEDVRQFTKQVARFMQPVKSAEIGAAQDASVKPPSDTPATTTPVVCFDWGAYKFYGTMDSYRETIDFFSSDGMPLRALVSIGLSSQDKLIQESSDDKKTTPDSTVAPTAAWDSALSAATRGGAPRAARQLAADNNLESLRFTGGASLQVNSRVQLNAAAGFTAGASAAASVSASASASAATGGAAFGARASAGVAASAGAFAGLETGRAKVTSTSRLNALGMLPAASGADVSAHGGASFALGGASNNETGAGLSADVGANFSYRERLTFDSDD